MNDSLMAELWVLTITRPLQCLQRLAESQRQASSRFKQASVRTWCNCEYMYLRQQVVALGKFCVDNKAMESVRGCWACARGGRSVDMLHTSRAACQTCLTYVHI